MVERGARHGDARNTRGLPDGRTAAVDDRAGGILKRGPYRLARGGLIERARPLDFTFDDRPFTGFAGDTLASALLANGVRTVARSFKFHRPRGIYSAGIEEPNALLELHRG